MFEEAVQVGTTVDGCAAVMAGDGQIKVKI